MSSSFSVTSRGLDAGLLRPLGPTPQNSGVFGFHGCASRVGVWMEPPCRFHIKMPGPREEGVAVRDRGAGSRWGLAQVCGKGQRERHGQAGHEAWPPKPTGSRLYAGELGLALSSWASVSPEYAGGVQPDGHNKPSICDMKVRFSLLLTRKATVATVTTRDLGHTDATGHSDPQARQSGPVAPLLPVTSCRWQGPGLDIGDWVNGSQLCDSGQGCSFCLEHFSPVLPWRQTPTHPQDPEVRCHLFLEAFQVSPGISPTPHMLHRPRA